MSQPSYLPVVSTGNISALEQSLNSPSLDLSPRAEFTAGVSAASPSNKPLSISRQQSEAKLPPELHDSSASGLEVDGVRPGHGSIALEHGDFRSYVPGQGRHAVHRRQGDEDRPVELGADHSSTAYFERPESPTAMSDLLSGREVFFTGMFVDIDYDHPMTEEEARAWMDEPFSRTASFDSISDQIQSGADRSLQVSSGRSTPSEPQSSSPLGHASTPEPGELWSEFAMPRLTALDTPVNGEELLAWLNSPMPHQAASDPREGRDLTP